MSTKGNTNFKARLRQATDILKGRLDVLETETLELLTPVARNGKYEWISVMDTDGTLVCARKVEPGQARVVQPEVQLHIGVALQSEWATSTTKPNPIGKATVSIMPHGVWVDVVGKGRVRLDRLFVLLVVPKPTTTTKKTKKQYQQVKRNTDNATYALEDTDVEHIPRGASAKTIADALEKRVRGWLKGKGRPFKRG